MVLDKVFLTTSDVARALGVKPQTVRKWRMDGRMKPSAYTPSGRPLYAPEDVTRAKR